MRTRDELFYLLHNTVNGGLDFLKEVFRPLLRCFCGPIAKYFVGSLKINGNGIRI